MTKEGSEKTSTVKAVFYVVNGVFWLSGAALVGLGVWLLVDESALSYVISFISEIDSFDSGIQEESFRLIAYLFLGVGFGVFVVGFCGCCGSIRDVQCMMGWFVFFLLGVIAAQLAGGIVAFVYRNSIIDTIRVEGTKYVQQRYTNMRSADYGLNWIQFSWQCCGVQGWQDYRNSSYSRQNNVPVSSYCCKPYPSYKFLVRTAGARNEGLCRVEAISCMASPNAQCTAQELNTQECVDSIVQWVKEKLPIFIGVGIGLAAVELVLLVSAICVCRQIPDDH